MELRKRIINGQPDWEEKGVESANKEWLSSDQFAKSVLR